MIEIYTDGGCSQSQNGLGGWAFVVVENNKNIYENWGSAINTTNNVMEIIAIREALKYVRDNHLEDVCIYSDSQYCVNSYNDWIHKWKKKGWKRGKNEPVKNLELWKEVDALRFKDVYLKWVRGHNGNQWNERADELTHNRNYREAVKVPSDDAGCDEPDTVHSIKKKLKKMTLEEIIEWINN